MEMNLVSALKKIVCTSGMCGSIGKASSLRKLTILAITLDEYGHINSCIAIGQQLKARGHRVVVAFERAWAGTVAKYGLEEVHFVDKTRDPNYGPNDFWIEYMKGMGKSFGLDPFEALGAVDMSVRKKFLYVMFNVNDELKTIIGTIKPDVILLDNYQTVPAVYNSGLPWVWLTSAGPLSCLPSDELPPPGTGFPTEGDRTKWIEYQKAAGAYYKDAMERYNETMVKVGVPPHPPGRSMHPSPYLNMYAYPLELDYLDIRPLPPKWRRFDHFIRQDEHDPNFILPENFKISSVESRLIYLSMGSMGCADDRLMRRLIDILGRSKHRLIVSMGPQMGKIELPSNIIGYKFLPQTQLLPLVDLVITHGGNNTLIEGITCGKPVLIFPLFYDQLDNAQRAEETGVGRRLNPFTCNPETMLTTIDELVEDTKIKEKVQAIARRVRSSPSSTLEAAMAVEKLALDGVGH